MVSLLSVGNDVRLILTLNSASSCMSQYEASKGEVSTRSRIALVVALPWVDEFSVATVAARLRRALLAIRVGIKGAWVFAGRCWPPLRVPSCPRPRGSFCDVLRIDVRLSCSGLVRMGCVSVGMRGCTLVRSGSRIDGIGDEGRGDIMVWAMSNDGKAGWGDGYG